MRLKDSFRNRVRKFRKKFPSLNVEAFLVTDPIDIFYFTGVKVSQGKFLIHSSGAMLCVDGRYTEAARKKSPFPVKEISFDHFTSKRWQEVNTIGFDPKLSLETYQKEKNIFSKYKKRLKSCPLAIQKERSIKDAHEITLLKKSAELLWKGYLKIQKSLKVGITEKEVALLFEFYSRKKGAEKLSFEPIIAFGPNTALPHHRSGNRRLKEGDPVLIDIGVVLNNYASDMTRMIFFEKTSKEIQDLFRIVKKAHHEVLKLCAPGVLVGELDQAARNVMGEKEKLFVHSLGHGIGLDVHEYPLVSQKMANVALEANMVITIEPGLYLEGIGGVRYEDMIVITKKGYTNLFSS